MAVEHILACDGERALALSADREPLVGEQVRPVQRGLGALASPPAGVRSERASRPGKGQRQQQGERADTALHVASTELE